MKYVGIADAYGLESFLPLEESGGLLTALCLRAKANRHRHAVVYVADIKAETVEAIAEYMKENKYVEALNTLKSDLEAKISFPKGDFENYSKSWALIPNPEIDPW